MKKPTMLQKLSLEYFCLFSKKSLLFLTTFVTTNPVTHKNKNRFLSHAFAMVGILLFMIQTSFGQVGKPFSPRLTGGNIRIKGDVIFVGNSMMSRTVTQPTFSASDPNGTPTNLATLTAEANQNYNTASNNNGFNQEYTDIDSDPTTFASSSAELNINQSCKRIVYAGLYWTAIYPYERSTNSGSDTQGTARRNDWNQIKFKVPGATNYIDIVADNNPDPVGDEDDIIYDANSAGTKLPNTPYACYKNVTGLLQSLADPNGNYFAANIRAAKGKKRSGSMAGWTLVIIYESPTLPSRYISTFDGFVGITSALKNIDFTVNGFRTLPAPLPVRATIGVATQEGESRLFGDDLLIKANSRTTYTFVNNSRNPLNNVFNSSITVPTTTTPFSANVSTRVPNSLNTLGFDMDLINVNNPNNGVIPNGETGATYRLTSTSDTYAAYVTTFAVDIIEPEIVLTKVVKNSAGVDIGNQNVTLGDYLNYEIGFRNVGNDDADQFTIKDVLPINILFDPNSIVIPNGSDITYTYTPATRTLIFTIPNKLVKINGNQWIIKFGVQVVPNCNDLSDACSDRIQNQAFATYRGITNPSVITDDPSISVFGNCNLAVAAPTNFLVGVDGCKYTKKYQLCGTSVAISAANGYNKYEWSSSPFVNGVATGPIIGTTQTITVTNVGTYYVRNTALAPCISIDETVTVEPFGTTVINPVIPFASEVVTCPNNGKPLPNIYLCGANAKKYIRTGVTDTTDIVWEKSSCVLVPSTDCADETNTCTWTQVATGPDFNVGDQGQYRITLRYANGCFNRYFFNVYENNLTPTATSRDIICNTNGEIVVGTPAAGTGYEYSLDGTTYQASNILPITTPNIYTVYIRSTANVANACVFTIPGIQIRKRDFTVTTTINNPLCNGGKGSVKLAANDVRGQYTFEIFSGATRVSTSGLTTVSDHTFPNLNPGIYTVTVTTEDGCDYTGTVTLVEPDVLTATAAITKALTCENGEITVTPEGGTGPFTYFVNSTTDFQGSPIIDVATAGVYNIRVVDFNNCEFTLAPISIDATPKPVFTVTKTDVLCYGANSGVINFNVTNANGYTLAYSIDNGTTYVANGTFSSLIPGTYTPILRYSLNGVDCFETQPDIVITEPAEAVTASVGVSELAGCGDVSLGFPKSYGRVRITNPQGGVAPYQYSFDNQATWITENDAYKAPGTYRLYVRDANGCIFSEEVILEKEPEEPVIDVKPQIDFNCDGTATSTVTVQNPTNASYTYEYYLDNVKNTNTPNNVFVGVTPGPHSIRVDYKLNSVPTPSNLLFENFGYGDDTTSPGINTTFYCFERQVVATQCRGSIVIQDGDYSVTARIVQPYPAWRQPGDHTPPTNPVTPKGRCLVINLGDKIATTDVIYKKVIKDIIPNQPINFELFAKNLLNKNNGQIDANLAVALVDATGVEISTFTTGDIPKTELWEKYPKTPITLDPKGNTTLTFIIRSNKSNTDGNDVAIDDISVYQLPKTCISSKSFPLTIDTGKAFTAQITGQKNVTCNGLSNGEITISATNFDTTTGYQYSLDNGTTWSTALTTSPFTIQNLTPNTYTVAIRPVGSSVTACTKTFPPVTITQPAPIVVNASATAATCTTGATITTVVSGGTPAYQYELRQVIAGVESATPVVAFNNNPKFNDIDPGDYRIYVRDANGCATTIGYPITVTAPPALTAALATTTDYCYTTADPARLDVTITGGTGPFTYKLDGNAAISSALTTFSFPNVAPGPHTILVTDSNNCTAPVISQVIAPQIGLTISLIKDLTCPVDAEIDTPIITGGNGGPYIYTRSFNGVGAIVTTFPFTTNAAGTYVFTVTDSKGCTANSNTITVTPKTTPVASPSKTDITCNGLTDGTITVTASGGFTSAYTYAIKLSTAPTYTTQTTNKFTGLAAGVYDVKVIDSKGCESAVVQVTIANPTPIAANATVTTTFSCSPTNTKQAATITVAPTGGTGGYTYSYNNGTSFGSSATLTVNDNGTTQTIRIIVKDGNGCTSPVQIVKLDPLNPPTITTIDATDIYCLPVPRQTSEVTITTANGVAPLAYTIISGPVTNTTGATTGIFSGLTAGTYVFRVTDANGCYATKSHNVPALTPIAVTATKLSDVDCFGIPTGSARFTVSSFSSTGNYNITVSSTPASLPYTLNSTGDVHTLTGLVAGTYTFSVTDITTGCTDSENVVIIQPTAALDVTLVSNKNANCNIATARVEVLAAGGTPNYRYSFVTSATTPGAYGNSPIANLNPTTSTSWYAHVIDAKGCTFILPITIATDPTPTVTATATGQCLGVGPFTITANNTTPAAGIVTPITYSLNGGTFQSGNTFTVTASGDYIVRIKDGNGCIVPAATITVVPQLTLNAVLNKDITCNPAPTAAQITLTPSGGSGSFTYAITTPLAETSNVTGATTGVFTTNTAGSYTFTVTDTTTGCTYTTTTAIAVTTPVNPEFLVPGITQTAFINCNGDDTAAISMSIDNTKGQSPFVFNIRQYSDPAHTILVQDFGTQTSGLPAGYYVVTVTDAKGCSDTETITITEPTPITFVRTVTPITCNTVTGQSLGSITINSVTGGTPNYIYHVTGVNGLYDKKFTNQTGGIAVFDVVDFGLYQIIITDDNGCTAFENNILVASPPSDLDISVTPVGPTCAGLGSAEIAIGASPTAPTGPGPYHFAVYSPGLTYTGPTTLPWYDEDAAGSKKTTIPNLIPGVIYTFIVHDSVTGCYYFETSSIAIPTNSTITVSPLTPNNITCKGAADGNVTFTMNHTYGVATPVTYQIYNSQSVTPVGSVVATTIPAGGSLVISNFGTLPFGNYFVLVTETGTATHAGCSISSAPFDITESAIDLSITANIIKNSNCNDLGIITGQAKDGTAPYTYQVTTSATPPSASDVNWVTGNTFTRAGSLAGTTYYVYAKDAYGCIKSDDVILLQDALPTITAAPPAICYDGSTAFTLDLSTVFSATILPATYKVVPSASSGTIAYQSGATFTFNAADTYRLFIKDGNGCEAFVDYVVRPQLQLSPLLTKALDCNLPTPNATVTVTASGGAGAGSYTYTITAGSVVNTTGATTGIFTGLDAGNYTFEVSDGFCTATATFIIDPLVPIVPTATVSTPLCVGDNANVEINATGGTGNYEYKKGLGGTYVSTNIFTQTALEGTVTYYVKDSNDCEFTVDATVVDPIALGVPTIAVTPLTCGTGNVPNGATITVTASGGAGGYEYSFDNGASYSSSNSITNAIAGTYEIIVKDANGCETAMQSIDIDALIPPTNMDIAGTPIYCVQQGLGDVTSTVTISNPQNGVAPFTYQIISPIAAIIDNGSNAVFAGLAPDTYVFQITDNNGCTYQESYTVAPVTNITVAASASTDVTCFNAGDGTATFDVANFGGNYNYTFDGIPFVNVSTAQLTFTNLTPVLHTLIVTDAITGCQATATVTISQPAAALDFTTTATRINCNNDEATITVTAIGGTPTYKYAVLQSPSSAPALTAYGLSNLLTVDTNGGANMVWDVYVIDANGCPLDKPQTIVLDANPVITSANHIACVSATGTYDITVIATGFNPSSFQYSADGSNYQTGNVITVNAPGNYTIYVKDANGCPSVGFPITILDPLILTPTVTTPVSCANGDGVIAVSTTGGSGNYEYKIDGGAYGMTTPFTGLAFGTHRVFVRDMSTGCEVFADIDLQRATPITGFDVASTAVTCNGEFDGTITATMFTPAPGVNDNPVYTYTLTGTSITGATVNVGPQDSPLFSGLEASDTVGYTVVVTSARGCTESKTIVVSQPAPIVVPTIVPVQFGCTSGNTGNLATITVTGVIGGTAPFLNYEFIKVGTPNTVVQFGNNNVYTEANLSGGSYIVNVYDSKGCIGTTTAAITIAPYIQLDKVNVNVTRAITCTNLEDIAVSATTIGGPATNLQYTLVDVTYDNTTTPPTAIKGTVYPLVTNTNGVFTNLSVGNYEITVRNLDTNCEIIGVHYVNEPNTFDLTIDNVVDVTCLGGTNGSARVTLIDTVPSPVNNAGPFTYTVTGPVPSTGTATSAGPINLTNLAAGTYTITAVLTNTPFCSVSKNFTIAGPNAALVINRTYTEITCVTGNNDGSISATATGGWPGGYEFQLERGATVVTPWSTTSSFNALTAGSYTVKVRDSKGCEVFTTVVLNNPTPIAFSATPSTTLLTCKGNTNATITVSMPTGGQGTNYLYTLNRTSVTPVISSGPQANKVFTNLGAGTYTVTVTDGWGCSATSATPIVIAEPTEVVASLVLANSATCSATNPARLTLSATGGTAPYSYSTTANFAVVAGTFASATTFAVAPGTYRFYVRDANGCIATVSNDIQVDPLPTLTVAVDRVNAKINCNGDTSGVIVAVATGGLGNYVYTLLNGGGTPVSPAPTQLTPGRFTNLAAGTYLVRVDSQDCNVISSGVITITQPLLPVTATAVATPVTCNGAANGIITVTASGGTGAIKYAIEPRSDQFFDTGVFDELAPGTYQIIVQDANGCYVIVSETITEPQPIFVNTVAGSEVQELCFGDNNAAFDVNITGGVAPYSVSIDNINGTYVTGAATQNVFNFTGLTGGDHTVYIKDANGCTAEWIVALDESVNLDPKAIVAYGCDNNSPSNTVTVTVDASITNLVDVDYALDGSTVFQPSNIFRNVAPGFHTITARHTNGCEKITAQFEVLGFTPLALTLSDGGLNEIVATATGGAGNYQYSFDGGNTFGTNNKLIYYRSGDYTVIVRDANGCEATATRYFEFIDIKIPDVFTPNGDGNNDTWTPTNTINYKDLTINIFDRYGRKVDTLREGQGWDGKYNGLELPTGDYWYVLKLKNVQDDREFVGHFTLMR